MRKLTIALCSIAALIAGFSNHADAKDKDKAYDRVMKSGVIECGYGLWDPFITFDFEENKPKGLVVDLMENIAAKINLKLNWPEETGWGNIPTALENGRIDVACATLWNDPARSRLVAFSDPIFYMVIHAYTRADNTKIYKSVADFDKENVKISVQDGDFTQALAKRIAPQAGHIAITSANAESDLMMQVATGKADIVFLNTSRVEAFNKNSKVKLKRIPLDGPVTVYGNSFAVSLDDLRLKEVLNTAVRNLIQTGEIEEITEEFRKKYPDEIILPAKPY